MKKKILAITVAMVIAISGNVYASDSETIETKNNIEIHTIEGVTLPVLQSGITTKNGEEVKDTKDLDNDGDDEETFTKLQLTGATATGLFIIDEKVAGSIDIEKDLEFTLPEGVEVVAITIRSNEVMYDDASITGVQKDYDIPSGQFDVLTESLFSKFVEFDNNKVTLKNGALKKGVANSDLITMRIIFYVNMEYNYSGDIDVVVSGDAINETLPKVNVATAVQKIDVKTAVTDIDNTKGTYDVEDIVIKELVYSGFADGEVFTFSFGKSQEFDPSFRFNQVPTVTTGTDKIEVDKIEMDRELREIYITLKGKTRDKKNLATLTVSDLQVYTDGSLSATTTPIKLNLSSTHSLSNDINVDYVNILKINGTKDENGLNTDVRFNIGSNIVSVDGENTVIDDVPYVSKNTGSSMIPLRALSEALGISENNIVWYQPTQTATIMVNNTVAQFTVGSDVCDINGHNVPMWTTNGQTDIVEVVDGRIYLPVRFLGEKVFGVNVGWDQSRPTEFVFN